MNLSTLRIHNFRGILDQEVAFRDYSLLVGPNNAGKSSVIDAIRAFYEKDGFKFRRECDLPFIPTSDKECWVELSFGLTDVEYESLPDDYKATPGRLHVRKYFLTDQKMGDGKSATGYIFARKTDGSWANQPFHGAKNVQSGKFGDLVYIPAISKVDEHAKLSGPSALRDLLTDIMTDVVEGGDAYRQFTTSVEAFSESIVSEKTGDDRSLAGFESELNLLLQPWDTKFALSFPVPSAAAIIKSMLDWDLRDQAHGQSQSIDLYGSGFQRHFIYSLIQLGARYVAKREEKKTKEFAPSMTLVLFEEPEAFLHPPQQETLARSLRALGATEQWQVVCSTHSPQFVSRSTGDIPAIARLRRTHGQVEVFQIDARTWGSIVDANQACYVDAERYPGLSAKIMEDDAKPEMEAVKHFLWLNPDRSSIFFANHVLLVEGPTEVALVNRLVGDGRISNPDCGLQVVDCLGKYNIHRFMNLLIRLGVSHAVIYDDDHDAGVHAELRQLIAATADPSLTRRIEAIPGDIEEYLGVPKAGRKDRKPQHLLYKYETGQIDEGRIAAFCSLVDSCLPPRATEPEQPIAAPA